MYNVLEVSRYIINYGHTKSYNISNLKLQKLLYFVQALFLISNDNNEPCFEEDIEAWDFGPVVPEVYHEYKMFGSLNIPKINQYKELECDSNGCLSYVTKDFIDNVISRDDKDIIDLVVDNFAKYPAMKLVEITHRQSPWIKAYQEGKRTIISKDSIRRYFDGI
ncbi:MAG: DUF4065 domain-containing protein [Clostridia bacterium]|nr:DUF4065 domain-containing protein [Clostridia bacterium]